MVGLDKFQEAFQDFTENYVIIGGTACDIVMSGTVVRARATHDIDMIIIGENLTQEFGRRFWNFINEGGYRPERRRMKEGPVPKYELYRFVKGLPGYPKMIELLARDPFGLDESREAVIKPLPISDEISSLSAIIMDDDWYEFTLKHSMLTEGVRHASPIALIALKSKAYLNLIADKANGKHVNDRDIKKHRSDVLKCAMITESNLISAPESIVESVKRFVDSIRMERGVLIPSLARAIDSENIVVEGLLDQLEEIFVVEMTNDVTSSNGKLRSTKY